MEILSNLSLGFETAFTFTNLSYAFIGCLLGTLVGILPGLGPLATISLLLPFTFGLDPTTALIMLAGIYYGSQYGGSTTAILVNLPGESASVVTAIDGYKMAQQGRSGIALTTAAIGSFFAGCVGTLVLAAVAPQLAALAVKFGAPDYFSLMVLGLVGAIALSSGSIVVSIGMIFLGVLLGSIGLDMATGVERLTFGIPDFWDGLNFVVLAVGLFAIGEVTASLEDGSAAKVPTSTVGTLWPNKEDLKRMCPPILRGTTLGSILGVLPGAGLTIASFMAYSLETRVSKYKALLGTGALEGVAGPESANNAAAQTAFIPTLTLGIPGTPTMALILGAMVMHNIQPGPQVMTSNPTLFWGLVVSMWIGNAMLVILNLPLVGLWVKLLKIPYAILFPAIILFCCIGVYGSEYRTIDIFLAATFGVIGYLFRKLDVSTAPLVLGFVLGPMLEANFRRSLTFSQGDYSIFVTEPLSAIFIILAAITLIATALPSLRRERQNLAEE